MLRFALFLSTIILAGYGCGYKSPPMAVESTIPPQINGLECSVTSGRIVLSWIMPDKMRHGDKVTGFRIYSGSFAKDKFCPDCPLKFQKSLDITLDSLKGLNINPKKAEFEFGTPAKRRYYTFSIQAIDSKGRFGKRTRPVVMFVEDIPDKIPGVSAIQKRDKITLSWEPIDSPEIFYNIYRSYNKKPFELIHQSLPGTAYYTDKDLVFETDYQYKTAAFIKTEGKNIEGEHSLFVNIYFRDMDPPKKPDGLFAICINGTIVLRWEKVIDKDLAGYNLYRASDKEPVPVKINPKPVDEPYYHDLKVETGVTYKYRISAVDRAKEPNESRKTEFYKIYCE